MRLLPLAFVGVVALSACSTVADQSRPVPEPMDGGQAADAAWIERNGPSPVPRDGWVETVSGWYRSKEACLQRRHDAAGTPLSLAEECLEPGN